MDVGGSTRIVEPKRDHGRIIRGGLLSIALLKTQTFVTNEKI